MPTIVEPKQAPTLQPSTEQISTLHNHVFRVHLPGFTAEDIRVEVDKSSRKITVRSQGIVARVDVPEDADIDLIGARLGQGWLSLIMPKKRTEKDKKSADPPTVGGNDSQKDYSLRGSVTEEGEKGRCEHKKEGAAVSGTKEKPTGEGKNGERSEDAREKASQKATPTTDKARARRKSDGSGKSPCSSWRNPIDEVEEWFDQSETLHKLMESFNKNRSVIAAAAVGFAAGFLVAQKLMRSSST